MTLLEIYDLLQVLLVSFLVLACALYCVLRLAPSTLQSSWQRRVGQAALPSGVRASLLKSTSPSTCGSACHSSCHACPPPAQAGVKPIQWHTRQP